MERPPNISLHDAQARVEYYYFTLLLLYPPPKIELKYNDDDLSNRESEKDSKKDSEWK